MRKGFTLLEIIIVIIIIGVLATLGFTQYGRMVERSRGAEARAICGDIRKFAAAHRLEFGALNAAGANFGNAQANIGGNLDQLQSACRSSHYFSYSLANVQADSVDITATRCTANGKTPDAAVAETYILQADLAAGQDVVAGTGNY